MDFFTIFLYQPLLNLLVLIYLVLPFNDLGVAVIILTLAMRFLLYPLMQKSLKAQKALSAIQPKLKEIQEKYKDDKQKQLELTLSLYKKENVSLGSNLWPMLIQLPVLIALYNVFRNGLILNEASKLYAFVPDPGAINFNFLGLIDLSKIPSQAQEFLIPNILLIALVVIVQIITSRASQEGMNTGKKTGKNDKEDMTERFSKMMQVQMLYIFPILTAVILWSVPAVISLYWLTTSLFSYFQQKMVYKKEPEKI